VIDENGTEKSVKLYTKALLNLGEIDNTGSFSSFDSYQFFATIDMKLPRKVFGKISPSSKNANEFSMEIYGLAR